MSMNHSKYDSLKNCTYYKKTKNVCGSAVISRTASPFINTEVDEFLPICLIEVQRHQKAFGWTKKQNHTVDWQARVVMLCSSRSFPLPSRKLTMQQHSAALCLFIALNQIMFVLFSASSLLFYSVHLLILSILPSSLHSLSKLSASSSVYLSWFLPSVHIGFSLPSYFWQKAFPMSLSLIRQENREQLEKANMCPMIFYFFL